MRKECNKLHKKTIEIIQCRLIFSGENRHALDHQLFLSFSHVVTMCMGGGRERHVPMILETQAGQNTSKSWNGGFPMLTFSPADHIVVL